MGVCTERVNMNMGINVCVCVCACVCVCVCVCVCACEGKGGYSITRRGQKVRVSTYPFLCSSECTGITMYAASRVLVCVCVRESLRVS